MLDHKVSPLLDAMEVGECFAQHDGASCYRIVHPGSGREFVLKHISVPATQEQVEALLLTGAYSTPEETDAYYRAEAEALVQEAEARKKLLDCPYILPFLGVQMEKKEGVGYDVYAVLPKRNSLQTYLNENAVSHLRGINMGIDLCVAMSALREQGYVHGNLKPGNVFFSDTGRFLLGDFGLISTQDMQYASLPEQYRSSYSAPELGSYLGGLNPTVDIYSLGMILYRIYNGNHAPFEDEKTSPKTAEAMRLDGEELPAPIYADYELGAIIKKACAFVPEERYQHPDEMRQELEQYMRRNAVSDHLIVPPLVTDKEPLSPEAAEAAPEPVRFTDPETLDEDFKRAFSPEETPRPGRKEKKERKAAKKDRAPSPKAEEETPAPAETPEAPKAESREPRRRRDSDPLPLEGKAILSDEPPQLAADRRRLAQKLKKAKQRRKRAWIAFAAAMLALVILLSLYEFTDLGRGRWHYFAKIESLEVTDVTADSLKLILRSNTDPDRFTALCQDAYGNSYSADFQDGVAVFTGLSPSTQYNLKVELPGLGKLSGENSSSATTGRLTMIDQFTASQGSEEGAVQINLTPAEGEEEPAFWTLGYGKTGETPSTLQFTGHSYQISGLELGTEYTFTLMNSSKLFLGGETSASFVPQRLVLAQDLTLERVKDGEATVSWLCSSELPALWTLRCADPDGMDLPVEIHEAVQTENGYYCSATVSEMEPGVNYSLTLSALGLFRPLTLELKDAAVVIEQFTGEATEDGLALAWVPNRVPEEGWIITAAFGDGLSLTDTVQGESCMLSVLPDTGYTVTIAPADGSPVSGETSLALRSAETKRFTQFGLNNRTTIGTYFTPEKENWSYSDLGGGTVRYRHDDKITFVITAGGWPDDAEREVDVCYVVRKANSNEVVHLVQERLQWKEMWDGDRWSGLIPWLPEATGDYTFTIYINSQRLGTIGFTLIG